MVKLLYLRRQDTLGQRSYRVKDVEEVPVGKRELLSHSLIVEYPVEGWPCNWKKSTRLPGKARRKNEIRGRIPIMKEGKIQGGGSKKRKKKRPELLLGTGTAIYSTEEKDESRYSAKRAGGDMPDHPSDRKPSRKEITQRGRS